MRKLVAGMCGLLFACSANAVTVYLASEDFEGAFPQVGWLAYDDDGGTNGEYYWVDTDVEWFEGSYSGWCAGAGADGVGLTPGSSTYPSLCDSWLETPLVDLSDAMSAMVDFYYLLDTEQDFDYLDVYVTTDQVTYTLEWSQSGYTAVWTYGSVDLAGYVGQSAVGVAFVFSSDAATEYDGAYIDWIDVTKDVEDNYEDNDTLATATDLTVDENTWLNTIDGYASTYDEDWYEIYVFAGWERVVIDCTFTHAGGDIDIELVDGTGTPVADSIGTSDDEHIDFEVALGDATYYVRVYGDTSGNTYDLRWNTLQPGGDVIIWCGQVPSDAGPGMAVVALLFAGSLLALRRKAAVARA